MLRGNAFALHAVVSALLVLPHPLPGESKYQFIFYYTDKPIVEIGRYRLMPHGWAAGVAFKEALEKRTAGRVEVDMYHSGALGSHKDAVDQVATGVIQGFSAADGHFTEYFPLLQVANIPYLFKSPMVAWEVFDGPFGQELFETSARQTGIRILAFWDNGGFRHLINNKREIRTPADVKGLKFRTMPVPLHQEMFKSWGGAPTAVRWTELYSALRTGVVDGMESSPENFLAAKLYEVQKYMSLTAHMYSGAVLLVNEAWIRGLPENLRAAVFEAGRAAVVAGRGAARVQQALALEDLEKKHGVRIYVPNADELSRFRNSAHEHALNWLSKEIGSEWVEKLKKAVSDAEAKLGYR